MRALLCVTFHALCMLPHCLGKSEMSTYVEMLHKIQLKIISRLIKKLKFSSHMAEWILILSAVILPETENFFVFYIISMTTFFFLVVLEVFYFGHVLKFSYVCMILLKCPQLPTHTHACIRTVISSVTQWSMQRQTFSKRCFCLLMYKSKKTQ